MHYLQERIDEALRLPPETQQQSKSRQLGKAGARFAFSPPHPFRILVSILLQ